MRLKDDSVRIHGISPEMELGRGLIQSQEHKVEFIDDDEFVITSGADGRHSLTSLHYSGNALDLRRRNLRNPEGVVERLKDTLGIDYDVILEATHIHVEYQPRRRDFAA